MKKKLIELQKNLIKCDSYSLFSIFLGCISFRKDLFHYLLFSHLSWEGGGQKSSYFEYTLSSSLLSNHICTLSMLYKDGAKTIFDYVI